MGPMGLLVGSIGRVPRALIEFKESSNCTLQLMVHLPLMSSITLQYTHLVAQIANQLIIAVIITFSY